jgi:hypothetical protein
MMTQTLQEYRETLKVCKSVFMTKTADYGTSWRVLRPSSLTDQIFIKAQRIRTIMDKGARVEEGILPEFIGIVNYCLMALIQLEASADLPEELPMDTAEQLYDSTALRVETLMLDKNHDYGEAWRQMRISTFVDMMLMRVKRIRQIEDLQGKTQASEGIDANYMDMMNYAMFALIQLRYTSN